jgi:uncharacterized membrane protein
MSVSSMLRATVRTSDALLPRAGLETRRAHAIGRLSSIDVLRGLVIVIMALDHVRAYFTDVRFDPLDPSQTNALLYLTRWITNLCAPTFILLAGVSAYLMSRRTTKPALTRSLVTRGLWLIVLEWTVVTYAWTFSFRYEMGAILQVIWAIGVSMIVLGLLVRLPVRVVGAIGLAICVGHNLLDSVPPEAFGEFAWLWKVLHVKAGPTGIAFIYYPLVPWVGLMAVGYALGKVYDLDSARRAQLLIVLGAGAIVLFVVLRLINTYGDPHPWVPQADFGRTVMAFMNVQKYPPSLDYLLATVGPALLLLAWFERTRGWLAEILQTFGRVPLFFYVLHIALAHLAAGLLAMSLGFGTDVLGGFFLSFPPTWGVGLGGVYAAWLFVIATLYPACLWFADLKARRRDWWLYYL